MEYDKVVLAHTLVVPLTEGVGRALTVIFTESLAEQLVAVIVSVNVYIVVALGLTEGLLLLLVNPEGLLVQL